MRKPTNWIAAILIIAAVVYLLMPRPPSVQVAEIVRGDLVAELSTTGVVESDLVDIAPRMVGRIVSLMVREGDTVSAGQVIARLESDDLDAQVDQARAAVSATEADLERSRSALSAQRNQSAASIKRAEAGISTAESQLADLLKGARPQEIEQAEESAAAARAQMAKAGLDLERADRLLSDGAIAPQQRDTAKTAADTASAAYRAAEAQLALVKEGPRPDTVKTAEAQVASARAALREAEASRDLVRMAERQVETAEAQVARAAAGLRAAQSQTEYAAVRSPFNGVIARKHMEAGEVAGPQAPIFTISPIRKTWVTAEVDQEDVAALFVGQAVSISTDSYPGRAAKGRVVQISPIAEPKAVGRIRAKIVRARIEVESGELPLRPGMEVDISGKRRIGEDVVLVPNEALVQIGERQQVCRICEGRVRYRFVTTGLSNYEHTVVLSGLEPGDIVTVSMPDRMENGQRVRIERASVESP
ncbi:MAG: efflux RND transporter periplasmic adaptor subunit [Armatimonadetes bacterium]|nr:efflux RND transporter periplasmic adaptor subunit [Armatimonadota bacterium]